VNRKVLWVDGRSEPRNAVRTALEARFEVFTAADAARALEECENHGPFAVMVMSDHEGEDPEAVGWTRLLERFHRGWPDTARVLVTQRQDLDAAIEALQHGAIFRLLRENAPAPELIEAIESGIQRHRQSEEERLVTEQLLFCRESLLELTETLESRLTEQLSRIRRLQSFIVESNAVESIEELATLAAESCSKLMGGRAVFVLLEDATGKGQVERNGGGPLSFRVHTEAVRTVAGEIGLLQIDEQSPAGRSLSRGELQMLRALSTSTAQAASNLLNRHVRQTAHHATIHALSRLAENRDDETAKHLDRVSEYCALIAEGMRADGDHVDVLTDEFIADLTLSAPLHDIGKVGIPDSILLKPGPLNAEEWEIMKKHSTIGAETMHHVIENTGEQSFLRMGFEIAWCHHERWDGTGYPRGLKGDEIPLAARIMALADVYDALTTWRPYKLPWTHVEAMVYLLEERGGHFEPAVVDAFARCAEDMERVRARLADEPTGARAASATAQAR